MYLQNLSLVKVYQEVAGFVANFLRSSLLKQFWKNSIFFVLEFADGRECAQDLS